MENNNYRNNLKNETSPYLLQHANNPVDWHPWNKESLELAKKLDKPIFLSIGYSTCHWCHVMAHESFENEDIAKVMNDCFVNIKVDKEERPDVDKVYMQYLHATKQGSGWPVSIWLTPELTPIVGGTYFPPVAKYGRSGFPEICKIISEAWTKEKNEILHNSQRTINKMKEIFVTKRDMNDETSFNDIDLNNVVKNYIGYLTQTFDSEEGGFGDAPKFPRVSVLEAIFQLYEFSKTHEIENMDIALNAAFFTLFKMAMGGMNDQLSPISVSGSHGFHRYSVDRFYHIPHYEKMMYDQAQLVSAYSTAYKICMEKGHHLFASYFSDVVLGVLNYVSSEMTDESGAVYTAEDADSLPTKESTKAKEGAYYVWEYDEIFKLIPNEKDFNLFVEFYGIRVNGNSPEGSDPHHELTNKNTLKQFYTLEELADKNNLSVEDVRTSLENSKKTLFQVRQQKPKPFKDTKILCNLNAMMACSFVYASNIFQLPNYVENAIKILDFIKKNLYCETSKILFRNHNKENPQNRIEGFSDDYAWTIKLCLDLYGRLGDFKYLHFAEQLQQKQIELFFDSQNNGGFFENSGNDQSILMRVKEEYDGAEPASSSLSLFNLSRLSKICKDEIFKTKLESSFSLFSKNLEEYPNSLPYMIKSLLHYSQKQTEIVIVGDYHSQEAKSALKTIHSVKWFDNKNIIFADGKEGQQFLSKNNQLLEYMVPDEEFVRVMICEGQSCKMPLDSNKDKDWSELKQQLENEK